MHDVRTDSRRTYSALLVTKRGANEATEPMSWSVQPLRAREERYPIVPFALVAIVVVLSVLLYLELVLVLLEYVE